MTVPTAQEKVPHYAHPAAWPDELLLRDCAFGQDRTSGPGGQHRNKVETKVVLTHEPTGLSAHAGERREMMQNKRVALRRLRLTLATEHRVGVPDGEIGSALWLSRITRKRGPEGKVIARIACSADHHDFPSMLAEALDVIAAAKWDHTRAALRLQTSGSQLLKLVAKHPPALAAMNAEREKRGMRPLKVKV
ncbi:MAG: peptide chain release factor-like protein [Planctomycetota bacterium]